MKYELHFCCESFSLVFLEKRGQNLNLALGSKKARGSPVARYERSIEKGLQIEDFVVTDRYASTLTKLLLL